MSWKSTILRSGLNQVNRIDRLSRLRPPLSVTDVAPTSELPEGLKVLRMVNGGGDSIVHSLWEVLKHHQEQINPSLLVPADSLMLRGELAEEDPSTYDMKTDKISRNVIRLSRLPGQVPPEEFFLAFCNLYGLQV